MRNPQRLLKFGAALAVVTLAVTALTTTLTVSPAAAHGAMQMLGSRTWLCYQDGLTASGEIIPKNPACEAAIAESGTTSAYNWFAVGNRAGKTSGGLAGFIPDGKLCSGNSNYYDFAGFDIVSPHWPKTHLTAGSTIKVEYSKWAPHPGTFSLYLTKPTWDPTKPLAWSDIDLTPFSTVTDPPSEKRPDTGEAYYTWEATLPAGYTGDQIIYSVWARSDSSETFYGCSDVTFDNDPKTHGKVTGIGDVGPSPIPVPCDAAFDVTTAWPGGYQASVTVSNPTTTAMRGWTASWVTPDAVKVTSAWNGTLSSSGSLASVKSAEWNGTLAPGKSSSFGFNVAYTGSAPAAPSISCTSP